MQIRRHHPFDLNHSGRPLSQANMWSSLCRVFAQTRARHVLSAFVSVQRLTSIGVAPESSSFIAKQHPFEK